MAASTTLITDATSMGTNGQTATTATNAIAAAGPVQDVIGMIASYKTHLQEAKVQLLKLNAVVDAGDANKALIANALLTLT